MKTKSDPPKGVTSSALAAGVKRTHVRPGDTVESLASRLGFAPADLARTLGSRPEQPFQDVLAALQASPPKPSRTVASDQPMPRKANPFVSTDFVSFSVQGRGGDSIREEDGTFIYVSNDLVIVGKGPSNQLFVEGPGEKRVQGDGWAVTRRGDVTTVYRGSLPPEDNTMPENIPPGGDPGFGPPPQNGMDIAPPPKDAPPPPKDPPSNDPPDKGTSQGPSETQDPNSFTPRDLGNDPIARLARGQARLNPGQPGPKGVVPGTVDPGDTPNETTLGSTPRKLSPGIVDPLADAARGHGTEVSGRPRAGGLTDGGFDAPLQGGVGVPPVVSGGEEGLPEPGKGPLPDDAPPGSPRHRP